MADNTTLNPGTGGDVIVTEQPGGTGPKYPISKIYTGAAGVNGGPVTATNPLDVRLGDATNTASVKAASTAPVAADKALVVAQSPNRVELVGTTTALNALNVTASINAAGYSSVGFFLAAGTLAATLTPEASFDGGTTWVASLFDNPAPGAKQATLVVTNPNAATSLSVIGNAGASQYRVRVSAFTSGTANGTLRANDIRDPSLLATAPPNTTAPSVVLAIGASDGTNIQSLRLKNASTAPVAADPALVVSVSPNSPVNVYSANATATLSNVTAAITSTTILASNTARKGATVVNDSTSILYLKFGSTASATSYTVRMAASAYYEVPFGYTGILTGIWVAANGAARVTEIT